MHLATISDIIDASPRAVWSVIGDFGGLKRWSRAVTACTTEGNGVGSYRVVQIGDAIIRERLEAWDPATFTLTYRPVSGSVMPVNDMQVSMTLTAIDGGKTKLDWAIAGEPTIERDKVIEILRSRYQGRIAELKECVAAASGVRRLEAVAAEEVPVSAAAVWQVIGDFAGIRKWAPAVMSERIEETPEGNVRVLAMPPDGREVRELLWKQTEHSYTYKFLGATANAVNYFGTVSVVPVDEARSRIELRSEFEAAPGVTEADAVTNMTKGVRGNLKAMKRALGLA